MITKKKLTEKILKLLAKSEDSLQLKEISQSLGFVAHSEEHTFLRTTMAELCSDGLLVKSSKRKYSINDYEESTNLTGVLKIKDGRGYVNTDSKQYPKVTIKRKHLSTALDGDTVQVKLLALKKEKKVRGEVIKVTNRINRIFIGTLEFDGNFNFLIPDDNKYYVDFLVPTNKLKGAKSGDKVSAKFLSWTDPQKSPQAEVIEILGKAGEPKTEYLSVIKDFALPDSFPAKALEETKLLPLKISAADIIGRLDYRKELVITIDPEDAKDFDDALSLKKLDNGNFQLGVHIADVSHYVKENSEIDKEALNRGTSVYLVDQVVPMLPELLSNEICSLKPRRVRLTFSVIMEINSEGEVLNYEIAESVINSKRRFSYIEVQKIIETGEGDYKELVLELDKLAKTLRERRFKKGGIDLQTVEVKFILDSNKKPTNALLRESNDSTQLVEIGRAHV